ncbi:MAG: hypothetical protein IKP50_00500 [Bacilli bacterium]|nr:hypothetical protein [Bacilli bacterium]
MAKSGINFQWDKSRTLIIRDKGFTKDFYQELGQIMERHMYKYTPYDSTRVSGKHLADSTQIKATDTDVTIHYTKRYANRQYYGAPTWKRDLSYHPLATSKWDQTCWVNEKWVIGREANAARKRYAQ